MATPLRIASRVLEIGTTRSGIWESAVRTKRAVSSASGRGVGGADEARQREDGFDSLFPEAGHGRVGLDHPGVQLADAVADLGPFADEAGGVRDLLPASEANAEEHGIAPELAHVGAELALGRQGGDDQLGEELLGGASWRAVSMGYLQPAGALPGAGGRCRRRACRCAAVVSRKS